MSLIQLTEYLLWKSIKHKTAPITSFVNSMKQEPTIYKQEMFVNDMICRVCTHPAEIPISEKIGDTLIISAIRIVANISIAEADCYPKYVCQMCLEELKVALKFKRKCEASDMVFRKAITHETILVTSSQSMVMHDFSLLLHQLRQKRVAQSVVTNKDNSCYNYNDEVMPESSPPHSDQESFDNVTKKPVKRCKRIPSTLDTTAQKRIVNILKKSSQYNDTSNVKTIDNVSKHKDGKKGKIPLKMHKCRRCDLKFDTKENFQKHRKENSCIYRACPVCSKLVLNLASHERIVHSKTHKYTCHQCGKIYYSSGALINHMHKHKDTKEYYCDHCPYRGKRKSYLVCHMRVHTGEHRYLCSMCPLKFTNPSNLTKHQLVHFNKKFECSKCKRLFRQEKQLKEHFDAAHLNIRYRCSICGRDLSSRKKLLSHELRVHKREKHKLFEEVQRVVIGNDIDGY